MIDPYDCPGTRFIRTLPLKCPAVETPVDCPLNESPARLPEIDDELSSALFVGEGKSRQIPRQRNVFIVCSNNSAQSMEDLHLPARRRVNA